MLDNLTKNRITRARNYRRNFEDEWSEIEKQVNCIEPDEWDDKEDWQTKIFIGMQSKTSETAAAMFSEIMFPRKQFYSIIGVGEEDRQLVNDLTRLINSLLERGKFYLHNDYVQQESIDLGTSFMKVVATGDGLEFSWRSVLNCLVDPDAIVDFSKSKFWAEEYIKDIEEILAEKEYYGDVKLQLLEDLAKQSYRKLDSDTIMYNEVGFDVSKSLRGVKILEYWTKKKILIIANDNYVLKEEENPYGCIPVVMSRKKRRKYHIYGKGYHYNTRGLQELMNSIINFGFDSLKINSFDIILLDRSAIADASTIEYKPLAVWEMKAGRIENGVKIQRNPQSAIHDIFKGMLIIDQFHQEISGVTKHAQGAPTLSKGEQETLGEYQLKLQAISKRFLKVAREDEEDYVVPLLRLVFKIITNPKLFNQKIADRILGYNEETLEIPDPITGQTIKQRIQVPKLMLKNLGEMDIDFIAVGTTRFEVKLNTLAKLKDAMAMIMSSEDLMFEWKIEKVFERYMELLDIPDFASMKRSEEEKEEIRQQMMMQQEQQANMMQDQAILDFGKELLKYDSFRRPNK